MKNETHLVNGVQEVWEHNDVSVGAKVVEEFSARFQDRSEQVPGVVGRQGDEEDVEAVEHLPSGQDVAEGQVSKDPDEGDQRLEDALDPVFG